MKETGQIMPEDKENFMNQESQTPHKRRVRYKGKYPKKFEEKYKELIARIAELEEQLKEKEPPKE